MAMRVSTTGSFGREVPLLTGDDADLGYGR